MTRGQIKESGIGKGSILGIQYDDDEALEEAVVIDVSKTGSRLTCIIDNDGKRDYGVIPAGIVMEIRAIHNEEFDEAAELVELTRRFINDSSKLLKVA